MMTADRQQARDSPPLWEVVALTDYTRPERPAAETVRRGLRGLLGRRKDRDTPKEPFISEEGLRPLPAEWLERAAPWPDWQQVVPSLDRALAAFGELDRGSRRIQALVGAPYSGIRETLRCWAAQHRWPVVEPPAVERILAHDESWFEAIAEEDGPPILIVELEHCILRHPLGLAFLRRLLDRLHHSPRPCLIAANSWAWTYLEAAVGIGDGLTAPITFQAFDADRLERWFRRLHRFEEAVTFCQADDGSLVLSPATTKVEGAHDDSEVPGAGTDFTRRLAGYSRGIAGVAWAVWRRSLGIAATEEAENRLRTRRDDLTGRLICVRPWSRIDLHSLPSRTDLPDLLLLHTLLIHGGLPERALGEVLPNIGGSGRSGLRKLAAHGIVEQHQGRWQVTPLGYPAAREALASEGLFVDPL